MGQSALHRFELSPAPCGCLSRPHERGLTIFVLGAPMLSAEGVRESEGDVDAPTGCKARMKENPFAPSHFPHFPVSFPHVGD